MTDRKGVEIDYCGQCRGVWLDRGELDKIIQLSVSDQPAAHQYTTQPRQNRHSGYDAYGRKPSSYSQPNYKQKKKKSLLGEVFDLF